jgi:hypothetical protein
LNPVLPGSDETKLLIRPGNIAPGSAMFTGSVRMCTSTHLSNIEV